VYFENRALDLLDSLVELQSVVVDYFVVWAGFSFELCGNTKGNTSRRTIIDVRVSTSGR